jgi:hypothetical protein
LALALTERLLLRWAYSRMLRVPCNVFLPTTEREEPRRAAVRTETLEPKLRKLNILTLLPQFIT